MSAHDEFDPAAEMTGREVRALTVRQRAEMWADPDWWVDLHETAIRVVSDEGVYAGDCMVIERGCDGRGYPTIKHRDAPVALAQALALPPPGCVSRHLCGNNACVNPNHIVPGTHAENQRDRRRHGTAGVGEANSQAKLTEKQVRVIRRRAESRTVLAVRFGTTPDAIRRAEVGETWVHLNDQVPPIIAKEPRRARAAIRSGPSTQANLEAWDRQAQEAVRSWIERHCIALPNGCIVRPGKPGRPTIWLFGRGLKVAAVLLRCDARNVEHECANSACVNIEHLRARRAST